MPPTETCCIFNLAPHYRAPIYEMMDKELGCDFYFGDKVGSPIALMQVNGLSGYKKTLRNIKITKFNFLWQVGAWRLIFKPYKYYIITGSPGTLSNWVLAILARLSGKKVFAWTHGLKRKTISKGDLFNKTFYKLCDKLLLYGNFSKNLMLQEGFDEDKLIPIYNSLDYVKQLKIRESLSASTIYREHFKNDYPVLIYIGRIQQSKKLDLLVKALAKLWNEKIPCNLVFVGADVENNNIPNLVQKLGMTDHVWFYGPCYDENEISKLLFNADVCVSPGPVGLTALHALTYGCPVISNDDLNNQMPEYEAIRPGRNGDLFVNDNFNSLMETIKNWINLNTKKRAEVRVEAYKEIDEKYNPLYQVIILKQLINQYK